jgi:hypothetical protein
MMAYLLHPYVLYVVFSFFIGLLGRKRLLGFWGFFLISLFLTPFIGVLFLVVFEVFLALWKKED